MATRDKDQGITFVYENVYELFKKAKEAQKPSTSMTQAQDRNRLRIPSSSSKVIKKDVAEKIEVESHREPILTPSIQMPDAVLAKGPQYQNLKSGIKRIQTLQLKLQFLLDEVQDELNRKS